MSEAAIAYPYTQRDAWLSILVCYLFQIAVGFFLIPSLHTFSPFPSQLTLSYCLPVLSALVPIFYLSHRYGWIHLSDLLPRGRDYLVILVAIFILFIRFALVALSLPYGVSTVHSGTISQLPPLEYYLVLFAMFLYGPFLEELLLRKYVFEIFRGKFNIFSAVLLTAFCASLLHIDFENNIVVLIKVFIYQAFYTLVYLKSRLGGSVFIHGLTNFLIHFTWYR
jgi:membrane protease YdiL (CAAX protease family)